MGSHTLLHCVRRLVFLKPGSGFLLKRKTSNKCWCCCRFPFMTPPISQSESFMLFQVQCWQKNLNWKKTVFQTCSFSTVFSDKINNINKKKITDFHVPFQHFSFRYDCPDSKVQIIKMTVWNDSVRWVVIIESSLALKQKAFKEIVEKRNSVFFFFFLSS